MAQRAWAGCGRCSEGALTCRGCCRVETHVKAANGRLPALSDSCPQRFQQGEFSANWCDVRRATCDVRRAARSVADDDGARVASRVLLALFVRDGEDVGRLEGGGDYDGSWDVCAAGQTWACRWSPSKDSLVPRGLFGRSSVQTQVNASIIPSRPPVLVFTAVPHRYASRSSHSSLAQRFRARTSPQRRFAPQPPQPSRP